MLNSSRDDKHLSNLENDISSILFAELDRQRSSSEKMENLVRVLVVVPDELAYNDFSRRMRVSLVVRGGQGRREEGRKERSSSPCSLTTLTSVWPLMEATSLGFQC